MPISDNIVEALDREKKYLNAINQWNSYQNWKKNRNPERALLENKFGYDTKHASHLFRLITEGKELLTKGFITFPRPDSKLLLDIKNGKWKFDELLDRTENYEKEFEIFYKNSILPNKPNRNKIDELCINLVKGHLNI